jgi:mRNA interferase YafQ
MSSKKPPSDKRATLPRAADYTKSFSKDWTRLTHSGRFNLKQLKEAMLLLIANDGPLGPEWLAAPGGRAKLLHPWPGRTPPPLRRGEG